MAIAMVQGGERDEIPAIDRVRAAMCPLPCPLPCTGTRAPRPRCACRHSGQQQCLRCAGPAPSRPWRRPHLHNFNFNFQPPGAERASQGIQGLRARLPANAREILASDAVEKHAHGAPMLNTNSALADSQRVAGCTSDGAATHAPGWPCAWAASNCLGCRIYLMARIENSLHLNLHKPCQFPGINKRFCFGPMAQLPSVLPCAPPFARPTLSSPDRFFAPWQTFLSLLP